MARRKALIQFYLATLSIVILKMQPIFTLISCRSCFTGCSDFLNCDCPSIATNNSNICLGDYCFVQLEKLTDFGESGRAYSIFKGCGFLEKDQEKMPVEMSGCNYYGDKSKVKCLCHQNSCNEKQKLNFFTPTKRPQVTCCACNTKEEESDIGCLPTSCVRNCSGDFCFVDMAKQGQGCGFGYPEMFLDFRTPGNFSHWLNNINQSCGLQMAGYPGAYWKRSCACLGDQCNQAQLAYQRDVSETQRKVATMAYCHNFYNRSQAPITMDAYRKSAYCEGHACFVSYRNVVRSELTASGIKLFVEYEMAAGCLMSDRQSKFGVGCTLEWSSNEHAPYTKHCVCLGDYCNLYNLIDGESRENFLIFQKSSSYFGTRLNFILFSFSIFAFLFL